MRRTMMGLGVRRCGFMAGRYTRCAWSGFWGMTNCDDDDDDDADKAETVTF